MRTLGIIGCLLCLAAWQTPCAAQSPGSAVKWSFQRTGFRTTSPTPQTALSMRSGEAWPVVYGFYENSLNAYSLFPVLNNTQTTPGRNHVLPATNWHQIGSNLNGTTFQSSSPFLQADSSATGGFAVSVQTAPATAQLPDVVSIGNSTSGFQSPISGAQAVTFDGNGNPFVATNSLIPNLPTSAKIFDVAVSNSGDVGVITQLTNGGGPLTYWQRSPLLGNTWMPTLIPSNDSQGIDSVYAPTTDLVFDNAARPYAIGVSQSRSPANRVIAHRFDITTGAWVTSILDSGSSTFPGIADVAAATNDDGIVGAAWVSGGSLKYAYLDSNVAAPEWTVTTVAITTPTGVPIENSQGVGLAFDNAGLPVISFVDRTSRQIWLAYDPPSVFGGGVTDQPGAEGDFNGDGLVDAYDLDAWRSSEGTLSGDDFLAWQRNVVIAEPPAAAAAVPEPIALSSGLVAVALLVGSTRNRRTAVKSSHISSGERRRSHTPR